LSEFDFLVSLSMIIPSWALISGCMAQFERSFPYKYPIISEVCPRVNLF
jgi:hypothetical protein